MQRKIRTATHVAFTDLNILNFRSCNVPQVEEEVHKTEKRKAKVRLLILPVEHWLLRNDVEPALRYTHFRHAGRLVVKMKQSVPAMTADILL